MHFVLQKINEFVLIRSDRRASNEVENKAVACVKLQSCYFLWLCW